MTSSHRPSTRIFGTALAPSDDAMRLLATVNVHFCTKLARTLIGAASVPVAPESVVVLDLLVRKQVGALDVCEQVNCLKLPPHEAEVSRNPLHLRHGGLSRSEQVGKVALGLEYLFTPGDRLLLHPLANCADTLDLYVVETKL